MIKVLFSFFLLISFSLFAECREKNDLVFLQLKKSLQAVQKLNSEIDLSPAGSDKRLNYILKKDQKIKDMQDLLYVDVLQKKISSLDPRACDKLLVVKKLLEIGDLMKESLNKGLVSEFENEMSSLELLFNPTGVCPKKGKNPRRYKVEKYL